MLETRPIGSPNRPDALRRLGAALYQRCDQTGGQLGLAYLDQAIEYEKQALEICVPGHPDRAGTLRALALSLRERCDMTDDMQSLDDAFKLHEEALDLCPPGDPDHAHTLDGIIESLVSRYKQTHDVGALEIAVKHIECITTDPVFPPHTRLKIVSSRVSSMLKLADLDSDRMGLLLPTLLRVCRAAIQLLPLVAYLGLEPQARLAALADSEGLGIAAAAISLSLCDPEEAMELLEETRAVFWSQALRLRSPLDDIPSHDAERLMQLFRLIEDDGQRDASRENDVGKHDVGQQRKASREAEALISTIRQRPEFDRFLLSQTFRTLAQVASKGPVVVLVVHEVLCEAVIILDPPGNVKRIKLPGLTVSEIKTLTKRIKSSSLRLRAGMAKHSKDEAALLERLNALEVCQSAPSFHPPCSSYHR